jgi:anti-sigma B factor antagonist
MSAIDKLAPVAPGTEMTIAFAATCREVLADAVLTAQGDVTLDLAAVSEFDSAGVQLLLATRRSLTERGSSLRIVGASRTVTDALSVYGLQALLPAAQP